MHVGLYGEYGHWYVLSPQANVCQLDGIVCKESANENFQKVLEIALKIWRAREDSNL